ncbi:MAG: arylsulfatase [Acidimicrobiales bacterium]
MQGYEPFEGVIGRTVGESTPWWPTPRHPRAGAPHVLVILIDDLGFAHFNCFGSDLATPNIDALAAGGLRYTNYHVTPLCSPTRAALLTGRNHHSVGMRAISDWQSGYPAMRGQVSHHAATLAEMLGEAGYATFMVGKWHLAAMENTSAAGPFDQWPLQRGFDRFYGFLDGETDQFAPDLVYDNHRVDPPGTYPEGYHLSEDLVDHALEFLTDATSLRPDRPCFTYLAFGATHAPHQAPAPYLARHRGRYDDGWDAARARWHAKQLATGVIPPGTRLAPRNPGVEAWDDLPEVHRRLAGRLQEAYAAFLEHTDAQIGRLVAGLDDLGVLDDTLILLQSDNGASQEGGPFGVLHEMKYFNLVEESPEAAVARLDDIGGPHSHANYPWGWAQAGNTPFKWYKQNTHEGGVHVPLVVHWPRGIAARGELRDQFHYVTDVTPTILEVSGVEAPATYRGYDQMPLAGTSLAYSFADAAAATPTRSQYFEMVGHRAMYHDGWKAVTRHVHGTSFDDDHWELYHLAADRSECRDLSAQHPERVAELVERWWADAARFGALPLDDRTLELFATRHRDHSIHPPSRRYVYRPMRAAVPPAAAASLGGRSWDLHAFIEFSPGDRGVLLATGNENAGLSFFVDAGRLVFDYNVFGEHHVLESTASVPAGAVDVGVRFRRGRRDADVALTIGEATVGERHLPFLMRVMSTKGVSVGRDIGSPVSPRYRGENPFTGRLARVEIQLVSPTSPEDRAAAAREGMARQ